MTTKSEAADAVIAQLAGMWPACFSVYERRRRPLKLGIHHDVLAALGDTVTPQALRQALSRYCDNNGYLYAMAARGAVRIDLNGQSAGPVAVEEAAGAAMRLAARKKPRQAATPTRAPASAPPPTSLPESASTPLPTPKRLSLADLRQAAQMRKAQASAAA